MTCILSGEVRHKINVYLNIGNMAIQIYDFSLQISTRELMIKTSQNLLPNSEVLGSFVYKYFNRNKTLNLLNKIYFVKLKILVQIIEL